MDCEVLQVILSSIFAEEMSLQIAKHCFFLRKQGPNKSIVDFASALWTLAIDCDFGTIEDELVTSQLFTGCYHGTHETEATAAEND